MKRTLARNACLAFSVALSLALCIAWVGSYFVPRSIPLYLGSHRRLFVDSGNGTMVLTRHALDTPAAVFDDDALYLPQIQNLRRSGVVPLRTARKGQAAVVSVTGPYDWCWLVRFDRTRGPRVTLMLREGGSVTAQTRTDRLVISYWILAIPPAVFAGLLYRRMRREAALRGLCQTCGYDLRATPLRCPECGTPVQSSLATG